MVNRTHKAASPVLSGDKQKKKCCILSGSRENIYCKAGEGLISEFVFLPWLAAALQLLFVEHVPRCSPLSSAHPAGTGRPSIPHSRHGAIVPRLSL